jgi:hypothetical protein
MRLNDVPFLPGDDPSGRTVASSVDNHDANNLGSFVTVTLRGKKPGQLDFEYRLSVSKTGNDIPVSWADPTTPERRWTSGTWTTLCRVMRDWVAPPTSQAGRRCESRHGFHATH